LNVLIQHEHLYTNVPIRCTIQGTIHRLSVSFIYLIYSILLSMP